MLALTFPPRAALAAAFALLLPPAGLRAQAVIAWADTGTDFTQDSSWTGGVAPANDLTTNIGAFATTSPINQPVLGSARSIAGLQFSGGAGAFTLSGAGTLTVGASGITNSSSSAQTISAPIALGAAASFFSSLASGTLTLSGTVDTAGFGLTLAGATTASAVSGVISGSGAVTKTSAGTWSLSGANTYTGGTTISNGKLNAVGASSLGTGNITLGGGTLALASDADADFGAARTINVTGNSTLSIDRANAGAGVTHSVGTLAINSSGNRSLAFSKGSKITSGNAGFSVDAVTVTGSSTLSLNSNAGTQVTIGSLSGGSAGLAFSTLGNVTISGVVSGTGILSDNNAGTLTLNGANTYTGTTTIGSGHVAITTLGNVGGGASSLGAPTTTANGTIAMGAGISPGNLLYTGSGSTSDRVINLTGTLGGAVFDASGTGPLVLTSAFNATGAGSKTLTLQGTNTDANTIGGAIIDNSATNKTSLAKSGAGTWVLSGANTYTGSTTISAGILQVGASNALPPASAMTLTGGTLALAGFSPSTGALALAGSATIDFANSASALSFANSSGVTWSGALTITNYATGTSTLRFGTDNTGLTSTQLALINFSGTGAAIDNLGYVAPIPEPATCAAIFGALALGVALRRRARAA